MRAYGKITALWQNNGNEIFRIPPKKDASLCEHRAPRDPTVLRSGRPKGFVRSFHSPALRMTAGDVWLKLVQQTHTTAHHLMRSFSVMNCIIIVWRCAFVCGRGNPSFAWKAFGGFWAGRGAFFAFLHKRIENFFLIGYIIH